MKKLVILALVTALAAGVVFAQEVEVTGFYRVGVDAFGSSSMTRIDSNGEKISDYIRAGATHSRGRLNFTAANDDGTFGGFVRVESDLLRSIDNLGYPTGAASFFNMPYAFAWWQPIEQLKLTAGLFDDFYVNDIVDTFGGVAEDTLVHYTGYESLFLDPFAQHYDDGAGLGVGIYPIEGLSLNIGVPFILGPGGVGSHAGGVADGLISWAGLGETAKEVYGHVKVQAVYELEDTVRIALGFHAVPKDSQAIAWNFDDTTGEGTGAVSVSNSAIFLAGYITAIENMGINIGLKFTLPWEDKDAKVTYNSPFQIGLGFNYNMDAFGIGARLGFALGSSVKPENVDAIKGPFMFGLNILPSYDLGVCKIFLNAGIGMVALDADFKKDVKDLFGFEPKDGFAFHINPYVEKSIGGGSFFVGFKLFADAFDLDADDKAIINWSVPCGMRFAF